MEARHGMPGSRIITRTGESVTASRGSGWHLQSELNPTAALGPLVHANRHQKSKIIMAEIHMGHRPWTMVDQIETHVFSLGPQGVAPFSNQYRRGGSGLCGINHVLLCKRSPASSTPQRIQRSPEVCVPRLHRCRSRGVVDLHFSSD